jgi:hypothetical protein
VLDACKDDCLCRWSCVACFTLEEGFDSSSPHVTPFQFTLVPSGQVGVPMTNSIIIETCQRQLPIFPHRHGTRWPHLVTSQWRSNKVVKCQSRNRWQSMNRVQCRVSPTGMPLYVIAYLTRLHLSEMQQSCRDLISWEN